MAGGKVSPRQKMINMMYLVLTALLALNVSKEVLLSFQVIGNSLQRSAAQLDSKNHELGEAIMKQVDVEVEGGKDNLAWIKGEVKDVLERSDKMVVKIEKHITAMAKDEIAGYDEETKSLAKLDEIESNYGYWMKKTGQDTDNNGRGAGEAKKLRDDLKSYVKWANEKAAKFEPGEMEENLARYKKTKKYPISDIAVDPKYMDNVPKESEAKTKTWEFYIFHGSPAIANVAVMQKLKNDVRHVETELLELSKMALSEIPFKIDSLVVVSAPDARIIPAGIPFTAKLYVTTSSSGSGATPKFSAAGAKIKLLEGGNSAEMELQTGGREGKQNYSFSATVPSSSGEKTLTGKGDFEVVVPGVRVQSGQVNNLYYGCMNLLTVTSPLLREYYNPRFSATGGEAIKSQKKKEDVLIVPNKGKVTLKVFNEFNGNTILLDKIEYRVQKPPSPNIGIKVGGRVYKGEPVPKKMATFQLIPDASFRSAFPKDANYFFSGYEVLVRKGLGGPRVVDRGGGKPVVVVNLGALPVKSGETVTIRMTGVKRKNFKGKVYDETFTPNELVTSFNIK